MSFRLFTCIYNIHNYLTFLRTVYSNNQGGTGAAEFISNLIKHADKIIAIDARYNSMSMESLSVISSALKASKGHFYFFISFFLFRKKGEYLKCFLATVHRNLEVFSISCTKIFPLTGRLEHLDFTGNSFCHQPTEAESVLAELRTRGQFSLNILLSAAPNAPYDDDP